MFPAAYFTLSEIEDATGECYRNLAYDFAVGWNGLIELRLSWGDNKDDMSEEACICRWITEKYQLPKNTIIVINTDE